MKKWSLAVSMAIILELFITPGVTGAAVGVTNTGADGVYPSASGSIVAFFTYEYSTGDLNGDGDTNDIVIRYCDVTTGAVTNTGADGVFPSASGSIIAFSTNEASNGQDLNGDGDTGDTLIRYYDTGTGTVTSTGAVGYNPSVSGSIIAFTTVEDYAGQDLNGDGDRADWVVRYFDMTTGTVTNTGADGVNPSASGSIIAFATYESSTGDLNGDGRDWDAVIRYYDTATGTVVNTGANGENPSASGSVIAFATNEGVIGQDLSGDGDIWDFVVRYYDIGTGTVTNTGGVGHVPSASGAIIAFYTPEGSIGQDLNGDGDISDAVIRYYDAATGMVTSTRAVGQQPSASGMTIAFVTFESYAGRDLNGDGDMSDQVIEYFTISEAGIEEDTIDSVRALVDSFVAGGSIDNEGVAQALYAFLRQAQANLDLGKGNAAENTLNAFVKSVQAQAGKHISSSSAQTLIDAAQAVIDGLR